jgi:hypothetical protein
MTTASPRAWRRKAVEVGTRYFFPVPGTSPSMAS